MKTCLLLIITLCLPVLLTGCGNFFLNKKPTVTIKTTEYKPSAATLLAFQQSLYSWSEQNCLTCHSQQTKPYITHLNIYTAYLATKEMVDFNNPEKSTFIKKAVDGHCQNDCKKDEAELVTLIKAWWNDGENVEQSTVTYSKAVYPIVSKYCFECHSSSVKTAGLALDVYAQNDYKLGTLDRWKYAVQRIERGEMPSLPELPDPTASELSVLKKWIEAGAPN